MMLSRPETQSKRFQDLVCKIDRLLRLYMMSKSTESSAIEQITKRTKAIMSQMQKIDQQKYKLTQETINRSINQVLSQIAQKKNTKPVAQSSKSIKFVEAIAFGTSQVKNIDNQSKISSSKVDKSENQKLISVSIQKQKVQPKQVFQDKKQKSPEKTPLKLNIDFNKKQSSAEISGSINGNYKTNINLKQFCDAHSTNIQQKLTINEDIVNFFKTQSPQKVTLLGVQKPNEKNIQKLYICTYMQFTKQQVTSMKFKAKDYLNQLDQFNNVIRYPLALCIIGQSISDMKVHYVKFLLEMTSPLPLVIIYNQTAPDKSLLIRMSDNAISLLESKNVIEMESMDKEISIKDKTKYKCINFKQIPIAKERCVTTKILYRKQNRQIIQNDQAIMVEKTNKKQTKAELPPLIKVEQNDKQVLLVKKQGQINSISSISTEFQYTLHTKFMMSATIDNFVYFISSNKQLILRKKFKNVEQSIDFIEKSSEGQFALGYTLKDKKLPSNIFLAQLKMIEKMPLILIRQKTLTVTKMTFLTVKPGVDAAQLSNATVLYKDIQSGQSPYIQLLISGAKQELAKYQNKATLQEI